MYSDTTILTSDRAQLSLAQDNSFRASLDLFYIEGLNNNPGVSVIVNFSVLLISALVLKYNNVTCKLTIHFAIV